MSMRKPIRLFVDAHVFDNEFQGTRTFIREIYARLAQRPELELYLAAHDTDNLRRNIPGDGIRYLAYKSRSSTRRLGWEIPRMLTRHGIDYAHFQYVCPPVRRCKYIVTLHDVIFSEYPEEFSWLYRISKRILFGRSARMADVMTTVSAYSERSIRKFLHVAPRTGIHIVPNGVGEKFFRPYDRQSSKARLASKYGLGRYILYVSRFEPRKNHNFLLKAWLELKLHEQGYYLVLLGHRSIRVADFDETMRAIPDSIRKFIFIAAGTDDDELMDFYRAAEIFVYPSKAEGFGIPPLEAAAMNIPVICSNSSAMEQFSFFGADHIDPADLDQLKQRLSVNLANPPSAARLEAIASRIRNEFSWEQATDKFMNALNFADRPEKNH